jgi:hypothetical protein
MTKLCKIFSLYFVAGLYAIANAQSTIASFTVTDPSGTAWAGGSLSYQFQDNGSFGGQYQWNGGNLPTIYKTPQTVTLDSSGSGSFTAPSNLNITPSGTSWRITVCPNASSNCTTFTTILVGPTTNLSSTITANILPPLVSALNVPLAYSDSEILTTTKQGALYENTGSNAGLRIYSGGSWAALVVSQLSIITYGADPTGVADSTTAIQNAINANQDILIPCGTYKVTQDIYFNSNNHNIYGTDEVCSVLQASWPSPPSGGNQLFYGQNHNNISFKNLTILGPSGSQYGGGTPIVMQAPTDGSALNLVVDHVYMGGWLGYEILVMGTSAYNANDVTITNSTFNGPNFQAAYFYDVNNLTITNNLFTGLGNIVTWDMDNNVRNYHITDNVMIAAAPPIGTVDLTSIVGHTTYFTVTTATATAYTAGMTTAIYGSSGVFNGDWTIASITDSTHFNVTYASSGTTTATGGAAMQLLREDGFIQGPVNPSKLVNGFVFSNNQCDEGGFGAKCEFGLQLINGTITGNTQTGGPPYGGDLESGWELYGGEYTFSGNTVSMGTIDIGAAGGTDNPAANITITGNTITNGGNQGPGTRFCIGLGGNSNGAGGPGGITNNITLTGNTCSVSSLNADGGMFTVAYFGIMQYVTIADNHFIGQGTWLEITDINTSGRWKVVNNNTEISSGAWYGIHIVATSSITSMVVDGNDLSGAQYPIADSSTGNTITYGCNVYVYSKPCNYTGTASISPGTNVTSATISGSNLSGTATIITGAGFTTGTAATISWPAVPGGLFGNQVALVCTVNQVGGAIFYGLKNGTATTTGMTITTEATATSATINLAYNCK